MAPPLDGIWARAPYLHNGSVPSLSDLLTPSAERPRSFVRGYDVYDQVKIGFISDTADAQGAGWIYDTSLPGNSAKGHEFGTDLAGPDRSALLEFMKTL